jgi:RNA polymerase sigma-70 factor (ECF subfamily)
MRFTPASPPVMPPTFEDTVVPHLGAAYRLARRLLRNGDDAEDVVQEACLRAHRYFRTFTGGNGRAWFLKIVRHTSWGWYGHTRRTLSDRFDEERHGTDPLPRDPESLALQADTARQIALALTHLPDRCRQLLELREMEGLSYRELAEAMDMPLGTVMSRLSRSRRAFRQALDEQRGAVASSAPLSVPDRRRYARESGERRGSQTCNQQEQDRRRQRRAGSCSP